MRTTILLTLLLSLGIVQSCHQMSEEELTHETRLLWQETISELKEQDYDDAVSSAEELEELAKEAYPLESEEYVHAIELLYTAYKREGEEEDAAEVLRTYRDQVLKDLSDQELIAKLAMLKALRDSPTKLSNVDSADRNTVMPGGITYEELRKGEADGLSGLFDNTWMELAMTLEEMDANGEITKERLYKLMEEHAHPNPQLDAFNKMLIMQYMEDKTPAEEEEYMRVSDLASEMGDMSSEDEAAIEEELEKNITENFLKSGEGENALFKTEDLDFEAYLAKLSGMSLQQLEAEEPKLLDELEVFDEQSIFRNLRRTVTSIKLMFLYDFMNEHEKLVHNLNQLVEESLQYYAGGIGLEEEVGYQDQSMTSAIQMTPFSLVLKNYEKHPIYGEAAYNTSLLFRNRLLKQSMQMRQAFAENQSDPITRQVYQLWKETRQQMLTMLPIDGKAQQEAFDSLTNVLGLLEEDASRLANPSYTTEWKQVRENLPDDAASIEFIQYPIIHQPTDIQPAGQEYGYGAVVLLEDDDYPHFVKLCTEKELTALLSLSDGEASNIYTRGAVRVGGNSTNYDDQLYQLLWHPLENLLDDVDEIYFSPTGYLNQVAFWALPKDEGYLMDYYSLHQISTTGLLARESDSTGESAESMVLFGGIDYDAVSQNQSVSASRMPVYLTSSLLPTDKTRFDFVNLEGTKQEIEEINQLVEEELEDIQVFTGTEATEAQLKLVGANGQASPHVIHVATHGFFRSDDGQPRVANPIQRDMRIMSRSGIALAGANQASSTIQQGANDGLLLASEVVQMDLQNTQLVVLSACETGLGEISVGEGVFGLQRSFKEAGTNYLLMSLWQVPDEETQKLMVTFYRNWLDEGMDLNEAFAEARKEMRDQYPNNAYLWAGFTLVE